MTGWKLEGEFKGVGLDALIDKPVNVAWTITALWPDKELAILQRGNQTGIATLLPEHAVGDTVMAPAPVIGIYGVSRSTNKKPAGS